MCLKRDTSVDQIEGLDRYVEDLQRDIKNLNDAWEGGVYIARLG